MCLIVSDPPGRLIVVRMALTICVKWSGKEYEVLAEPSDTVEKLKVNDRGPSPSSHTHPQVKIMEKTGVRPERQKLLNLKVNL